MSELFDAVDALVASRSALPSAEERKRLRVAHGLTLDEVAVAAGTDSTPRSPDQARLHPATATQWERLGSSRQFSVC
jgi:transcriptional regulator with XRE-family HTH domain